MNYNIILKDISTGVETIIETVEAARQTDAKRIAGRSFTGKYDPLKQQLIVSRDTARNRRLIEERNRASACGPVTSSPEPVKAAQRARSSKPRTLTKQEERRRDRCPETDSFRWKNANSGGKFTNDCVIRAIAEATGQTWEETAEGLFGFMLKTHLMMNDKGCYPKYLESLGWVKHQQPRKDDNTKYTGEEFCELLSESNVTGSVIAHIGGHHIVAITPIEPENGSIAKPRHKVIDTWNSTKGCIGNFWTHP